MLKHKSFVIKSGKKPNAKVMSMAIKECHTLKPEIVKNNEHNQVSGHYDKNEKITLSLPQSLSFIEEDFNSQSYSQKTKFYQDKNHSEAYTLDNEEVEESYSDANAYFEEENNFIKQQSNQIKSEESKTDTIKKEVSTNDEEQTHDAVVVSSDEILDNESIIEQDKMFEEDIESILNEKKQFDKERIEKNPEEAIKDKNHGLFNKKDDQAIEDKLKNDHAIFDKIAQSMEMASSYDLGAITMDKKFDSLEKETDKDFTK